MLNKIILNTGDFSKHSVSHRGAKLYFGAEVEFDGRNASADNTTTAENCVAILKHSDIRADYESDMSLRNGLELVIHPLTEEYIKLFGAGALTAVFNTLSDAGYNNDTGRAGGHLHFSRRALGKSKQDRQFNLLRLYAWLYENRVEFQQFSRRHENDMANWYNPYLTDNRYNPQTQPLEFQGNMMLSGDKFRALNNRHEHTVEIRTFGAYLNYQNFVARVEAMRIIIKALTGWSSKVLENYTFGQLMEANRKNAPAAYAEYQATKNGKMVNGTWVAYNCR
jgi:hypothetical protein